MDNVINGRPQDFLKIVPDGSRGPVQRHQGCVPAADERGGSEGSLSRMASGHDEGISGQRLLLPWLRGRNEGPQRKFSNQQGV